MKIRKMLKYYPSWGNDYEEDYSDYKIYGITIITNEIKKHENQIEVYDDEGLRDLIITLLIEHYLKESKI